LRALFLSVHRPGRSPSQRFRFEQYLPYLRGQGIDCVQSWVLDEEDDRHFYGGRLHSKAWVGLRALGRRVLDVSSARFRGFDLALVQREAFFAGPPWVEAAVQRTGAALVFDYDDSIWIRAMSEANLPFAWLKPVGKTDDLIRRSDLVLAGNEYLAEHARPLATRVAVMPTTIDTDEYVPERRPMSGPVCIGWSGSFSTIPHFRTVLPVLRRVKDRLGDGVVFKVIGDGSFREPELGIVGAPWRLASEVEDLRSIDVGIMPLPDDEWSRGKCGLKGLQYMALGIPTVMSPVGVNSEILRDGESGYLPRSEDDWVERLCALAGDATLRRRVGDAGRDVVVDRYSLAAWKTRYLDLLKSVQRQ
jgi:glycosyltransferase involved in cell wall biosynthesis